MVMLAQLTVDAPAALVGSILLCLIAVSAWWAGTKRSFIAEDERFEKRSTPPAIEKFATKEEVKTVDGKVDQLRKDVADEFRSARDASAQSRKGLYDKVNGIAENVAAIKERNDLQSAQITNIDHKVDRLLTKGNS